VTPEPNDHLHSYRDGVTIWVWQKLDCPEWEVEDWSDMPVDRLGRPRREGREEIPDNSLLQYLSGNR
jgi:hypothetical protein